MQSTPEMVALLLKAGADVNEQVKDGPLKGSTALIGASVIGNIKAAELLIEAGADVNAKDSQGHTPLNCIYSLEKESDKKFPEFIELLKREGAEE